MNAIGYIVTAGIVLATIEGIRRLVKHTKKPEQAQKSVWIGDIEVVYGLSTPHVFDGSEYRAAYETLVQEEEIPFITCELQTVQDTQRIGDLIFEASPAFITEQLLMELPISEIYLEK